MADGHGLTTGPRRRRPAALLVSRSPAPVQLAGGWDLDDGALRAHVRGSLAGYKVPRQVVASPW
jgi:hypothetical protein